jgi:hypothetical protein
MSTPAAAARPARDHRRHWHNEAACRDADPELFFRLDLATWRPTPRPTHWPITLPGPTEMEDVQT